MIDYPPQIFPKAKVTGAGDLAMDRAMCKFIDQLVSIVKQTKQGKFLVKHEDGTEATVPKRNLVFIKARSRS